MDLYASSTAASSTAVSSTAASSTAASSAASTAAATAASTVASTAASSTAATALELDYHLYHDTVTKKMDGSVWDPYQVQSKEFRDAQWAGAHKAEAAAKRWLHKMKSSTTAG